MDKDNDLPVLSHDVVRKTLLPKNKDPDPEISEASKLPATKSGNHEDEFSKFYQSQIVSIPGGFPGPGRGSNPKTYEKYPTSFPAIQLVRPRERYPSSSSEQSSGSKSSNSPEEKRVSTSSNTIPRKATLILPEARSRLVDVSSSEGK